MLIIPTTMIRNYKLFHIVEQAAMINLDLDVMTPSKAMKHNDDLIIDTEFSFDEIIRKLISIEVLVDGPGGGRADLLMLLLCTVIQYGREISIRI